MRLIAIENSKNKNNKYIINIITINTSKEFYSPLPEKKNRYPLILKFPVP